MTGAVAIVGASLAGAAAAATLRSEGFDGRVVLVGAEPHLPYERPPLSKELLRGTSAPGDALLYPPEWYADNDVEVLLGRRATRVVPAERAVELSTGERLVADAVILTTGGRPRRLPRPPSDRVLYLRTLEDAERLAARLGPGRRVVLMGLGFIGAEVAASARGRGTEVVALEMLDVPLEHLLGKEMGQVCAELHRDQGVDLRTGERVEEISETADGVVVSTADGDRIEGDAVVVGIGMTPNVEVAEASGIVAENGVVVDEYCRTSQEGVYAAGDVANHWHPLYERRLRVEHYDNALGQGAVAARTVLGIEQPFTDPHWFWSEQYEHDLQYAGHVDRWDELVVRGSVEERDAVAFYLRDGVLEAAFGINRGRDVRIAKRLIARRATPDTATLRDADTDLRTLL